MTSSSNRVNAIRSSILMALLLIASVTAVSAETLLMPNRPMLRSTSEVVWGITTQPNGTAYTIDFGDGNVQNGNVADRSYIAFNHSYALAGTWTVTLTVGAETATTQVAVYDPATLSPFDLRGVNVNRAIENGLRYLWYAQSNRTTFDTVPTTYWGNWRGSFTALVVLSFENHGYSLPNSNAAPTGIYPKYVVERGLNFIGANLGQVQLNAQPAGNPCVGSGIEPPPCVGLQNAVDGDTGYSTAVASLPFSASNALNRSFPAGLGYVSGKTYREVLQRMMNAQAWGQNDFIGVNNNGRGGWYYNLTNNANSSADGSTIGWNVLAQLDASAGGVSIPAFVKPEYANYALLQAWNVDGSYDYQADQNPNSFGSVNLAKAGIALQGMYWAGYPVTDPKVQTTIQYISDRWNNAGLGQSFACGNGTFNKGCPYGMFNAFKGLALYGIETLPGVTRGAGPGPIVAGDWYEDYVDWLLANQTNPTSTTGGNWGTMYFSCCTNDASANAAIAELILAPVALIQPDPTLFATVGLGPALATNPPGTNHTVTATAQSANFTPVPGATISFLVLTGPNAGKTGSNTTNANGQASFTYADTSTGPYPMTDTIQAYIGQVGSPLSSNIVEKIWAVAATRCDVDSDGDIDLNDLSVIRTSSGTAASSATDPRDGNGDMKINSLDYRYCSLRCTRANCSAQ